MLSDQQKTRNVVRKLYFCCQGSCGIRGRSRNSEWGSGARARAAWWRRLLPRKAELGIAQHHNWHFAICFAFPGDGRCGTRRRVRAGWERAGTGTQPGASSGAIQHAVAFPYCCPKHPCLTESGQFQLQDYYFGLPH